MAPALFESLTPGTVSAKESVSISSSPPNTEALATRSVPICSDPSVVPSDKASKRTRDLWWLHGHPHSKRYSDPKLVSLGALIRHTGQVYKGQKGFLYPVCAKATTPYHSLTWDEFDAATESIALSYASQLHLEFERANEIQKQPTIALLGAGKSFEYYCTQLALQKLGARVLLLAESNSLSALHHLLESCEALAVITDLKNSGVDTNGLRKLHMIDAIPRNSKTQYTEVDAVKFQDVGDVWERHTFIIHSSGSTGMPKPIVHTNRSMMLIARMYRLFQDFEIENWFLLFPLYHIAGISIALSGLPNGQIVSFPPLLSPYTSSSIFTAWKTLSSMGHPVDCVHCAPILIENMYEHIVDGGGDFTPLASLKLLQPGGAVLSDSIIQDLIEHGVNVKSTYGSTEIGPPFRSLPMPSNKKCYSFRNLYPDNPFLKMEQVGEGLYECVVYKGFELAANLWEGKPDNEPFRTNDLFAQDPPGSGFYVLQGRRDDFLVHSNGENTNAGALQLEIQTSSKVIKSALALGHSQPCVSLLIEVHEEYDPRSPATEELVWKTVEKVNAEYPTYSQIMRPMIYILPRGSTLPVSPKGNVKRKEAEKLYASDIARLYGDITSASTSSSSSQESLVDFLRNLFARLSGVPVTNIYDWTTIFDLGIESQLALDIRNSLSRRLGKPVSLNTIFENPSISKLLSVFETTTSSSKSERKSSTQVINQMISKLEAEFKTWAPRSPTTSHPHDDGEIILLTGSTGSLGTSLLETLSSSRQVTKIYAMVRGPDHVARVKGSLERKGMDPSILDGGKIEVLNFSMQDPLLGLDIDTYHRLATSVTTVVQNAWKMDFNMGVEEFEGDCIRSTMSLLRFCYAGRRKRMVFMSSISTCMGPGQTYSSVPELPIGNDPSVAQTTGYAQSKYIIERITQTASRPTSLNIPILLLRIGQLCGSSLTGTWNTQEMYPLLLATSFHPLMRCLPCLPPPSLISWLPVNIAAHTITELLFSSSSPSPSSSTTEATYRVHNITNPTPIPWTSLLSILHAQLPPSFPIADLPIREWVTKLQSLADDDGVDAKQVPGLKLLGFFEGMVEGEGEGGSVVFETAETRRLSKSLSECGPVCEEWIAGSLEAWKKEGFIVIP